MEISIKYFIVCCFKCVRFVSGPDMLPDLVELSNGSSSSGSENEQEEHEVEDNKIKTEENSLTPPLDPLAKSEGEESVESGQESGDDTDSSGSASTSSKSSQSSGMYDSILHVY